MGRAPLGGRGWVPRGAQRPLQVHVNEDGLEVQRCLFAAFPGCLHLHGAGGQSVCCCGLRWAVSGVLSPARPEFFTGV